MLQYACMYVYKQFVITVSQFLYKLFNMVAKLNFMSDQLLDERRSCNFINRRFFNLI